MKKPIILAFTLCGVMVVATTTLAYTLGAVDVGELDTLAASAKLSNSGDQAELDWINSVLNTHYSTADMVKYDTGTPDWTLVNGSTSIYAHELVDTPEYYLIKTGNVGTFDHFLFTNTVSLSWAVLNLNESFGTGYEIKNIGKFSHTDEFGNTPVPEPVTMLLFGTGLAGLAAVGGRKRS